MAIDDTDTETETETETDAQLFNPTGNGSVPRPSLDPITNRYELVHIFDAENVNPNGDPHTEENRPRVDPDTDQVEISAIRLKRIVRDYIARHGHSIFIAKSGAEQDRRDDKNHRIEVLQERMGAYLGGDPESGGFSTTELEQAWLAVAADMRMFGDAMAADAAKDHAYLKQVDGPIQVDWSKTLHPVRVAHDGQTSVLAADTESQTNAGGNMFTSHRIRYGIFRAHAAINEHNAQDALLGRDDVDLFTDALWNGISEQHSSSKFGHQSRLLVRVTFAEGADKIGDLHRDIGLDIPDDTDPKALRGIKDATLNVDPMLATLDAAADVIDAVHGRVHRRIRARANGDVGGPETVINAFNDRLAPEITVDFEAR